jgi:hypothetical protein
VEESSGQAQGLGQAQGPGQAVGRFPRKEAVDAQR